MFTIADDILVVGYSANDNDAKLDNDQKLQKLYKRCLEQSIVLNYEKKAVGKEITFHGYKITEKEILPDSGKIQAIMQMKRPSGITEIRRFCGLVQCMSRFVPGLADTLEPIRNLTRQKVEWNWSKECEESWKSVKSKLTKAPVLAYFDPEKELVVQVDSSKKGLGAVLLQDG